MVRNQRTGRGGGGRRSGGLGFGGLATDQVGQGRDVVQALNAVTQVAPEGHGQRAAGRFQAEKRVPAAAARVASRSRADLPLLHVLADVVLRQVVVQRDLRPGRLHHKSCSEQDFFEVVFVPAGGEAFVLDADLAVWFVLQQAQRGAAEDAEVGVGVAFADAALVFLKRHVELPVQTVLDPPVAAHRRRRSVWRREVLAEDVVADFVARPCRRASVSLIAMPIAFKPVQRARSGRSSGTGQMIVVAVSSRPCPFSCVSWRRTFTRAKSSSR